MSKAPLPSPLRVGLGFLIGPAVGAGALVMVSGLSGGGDRTELLTAMPGVLLFCYALALLLGLPIYLTVRGQVPFTCSKAMVGGAAVAAMPVLLLFLLLRIATASWRIPVSIAAIASAGAISGLVFWLMVKPRPRSSAA